MYTIWIESQTWGLQQCSWFRPSDNFESALKAAEKASSEYTWSVFWVIYTNLETHEQKFVAHFPPTTAIPE